MLRLTNKYSNRGKRAFTLVELIVVLVILAILAALGVPALLSYIDGARENEMLTRAQAAMAAAQAETTACYNKAVGNETADSMLNPGGSSERLDKIARTAGMPAGSKAEFGMKNSTPEIATPANKDAWMVYYFAYCETGNDSDKAVFYDGDTGQWETDMTYGSARGLISGTPYQLQGR